MHRLLVATLAGATALAVLAGPAHAAPLSSTEAPSLLSDPTARWQVVAGTFASRRHADEVLKRLQTKGIKGFSVTSEVAAERRESSSDDSVTASRSAAATELRPTSESGEATERAKAARFEVARTVRRTIAVHRDERTLRSDGFRPMVEREATH
jgi:hypothetical protein